jgi:DDE family transposase/integrase-like protein
VKVTSCIPQLNFSFYPSKRIQVDFCGGQISSDAGLLPLRAFDQRHGLTLRLTELVSDPREDERVHHSVLSLFRQRIYQIIAGYEDANDADRLRYDPAFQILADQPLGQALGSQPTLSRWENAPSAREMIRLQDALLDWFIRVCGPQVRKCGEILLDVDSTDAHRFRDTFAVELLLTGTSIEEVAVLLGHSNIKVTQKHYNPWVLKRQKLLEANVEQSWRDHSILLSMGTQRVHRERSQKANLFIIGAKEVVPAGGIEPTA